MLTDKLAYYNETGKLLKNTPAQYKMEFPWLKEVDSLALANAQMHLQAAYDRFFKNPVGNLPKFKSKRRAKKSYTTNCANGNIVIQNGSIRLPKIGFVRIKLHRGIPSDFKLKAVTVIQDAKGRYYASVLFEYEPAATEIVPESIIGLEYSDNGLFVDSNGEEIRYPDYIQKTLEKLQKEKQKLHHMRRVSKNHEKQHMKIMHLREKFYRQRDDFLHKKSRQIANAYDCVCIKDPAQGIYCDFGWVLFRFYLQYKMTDEGKRFIRTDDVLLSEMLYSVQAV